MRTVRIIIPLAAILLWLHVELWSWGLGDCYGAPDLHIWRAVSLMVRHGTLEYAYDHATLARVDPQAMAHLRATTMGIVPWAGGWLYMPPAAMLTLPTSLLPWQVTRYGFAIFQLGLWCWMFSRAAPRQWRWAALAAAPWLPGVHDVVGSGSSTIILLWLACHGGTLGAVMAGWCKPWVWAVGWRYGWRFWGALGLTGLMGVALVGVSPDAWFGGFREVQVCGRLTGHHMPVGVAGIGMLFCAVLGILHAHPAWIVFVGFVVSPVWWQGYWLALWLAIVRMLG